MAKIHNFQHEESEKKLGNGFPNIISHGYLKIIKSVVVINYLVNLIHILIETYMINALRNI